jgi:hypothetical protein
MRCALAAFCLDGRQRLGKILLRQGNPKLIRQHSLKFALIFQKPPFDLSRCMADIQPGIEKGDPRAVRPGARGDQIAAIWAIAMACREPIDDFVLSIHARQHDDTIDMLPPLSQPALQGQLITHNDETHRFVGRVLDDIWQKREGRGGREIAEADIREEGALRQVHTKHHVQCR